jgi:hypothetical protein
MATRAPILKPISKNDGQNDSPTKRIIWRAALLPESERFRIIGPAIFLALMAYPFFVRFIPESIRAYLAAPFFK